MPVPQPCHAEPPACPCLVQPLVSWQAWDELFLLMVSLVERDNVWDSLPSQDLGFLSRPFPSTTQGSSRRWLGEARTLSVTLSLQLACRVASDRSLTSLCALCSFPFVACPVGQHFGGGKSFPLAIHSAWLLLKQLAAHLWHKVPSFLLQPGRQRVTLLACHGHDSDLTGDPHLLLHPSCVSYIRPATLTGGFGYCPGELDLRPRWSGAEIGTFSLAGV